MSIKVTGLTPNNVQALKEAWEAVSPGGIGLEELGATFVIFHASTPADALEQVQADMDHLRATAREVRQTRYQSLIAVRNKLRTAVQSGHHHVKVV